MPFAKDMFPHFEAGNRSLAIDPAYHKYGWATYWENGEWWAKGAQPSLKL
ncbi:MAG: hypothetical protein ACRYFX_28265 [Janthinobacterium lividum]